MRSTATFNDKTGVVVTTISVTHLATYQDAVGEPTDEALQRFLPSVAMHVTPFEREFFATMTNRLGMPAFYLPLLRRDDVVVTMVNDEAPIESEAVAP